MFWAIQRKIVLSRVKESTRKRAQKGQRGKGTWGRKTEELVWPGRISSKKGKKNEKNQTKSKLLGSGGTSQMRGRKKHGKKSNIEKEETGKE